MWPESSQFGKTSSTTLMPADGLNRFKPDSSRHLPTLALPHSTNATTYLSHQIIYYSRVLTCVVSDAVSTCSTDRMLTYVVSVAASTCRLVVKWWSTLTWSTVAAWASCPTRHPGRPPVAARSRSRRWRGGWNPPAETWPGCSQTSQAALSRDSKSCQWRSEWVCLDWDSMFSGETGDPANVGSSGYV